MKLKLLSKSKMETILQSSKKPNILPKSPKPVQKEPKFGFFWTSFAFMAEYWDFLNIKGLLLFGYLHFLEHFWSFYPQNFKNRIPSDIINHLFFQL